MNTINVIWDGKRMQGIAGLTVGELINGEKPCGGHGKCGKCKVIAKGDLSDPCETELRLLSKEERDRGIRLACLTYVRGDCQIESIREASVPQIVTEGAVSGWAPAPAFLNYGVAVDIGTTTVAARLYDGEGRLISWASRLNPQVQWGADVISRVEAALGGAAEELTKAIRMALNETVTELTAPVPGAAVEYVVITGNTVMLSLLTGQSVGPFSRAPFAAERLFAEELTAEQLSLEVLGPETPVYLPPCISAFVGADITCALLACDVNEKDTAMLADIGTNGELALWHRGKLTVCATAAGPAFEGVGVSMGMRGAAGAIDRVMWEDGRLDVHVIGETAPQGICGSGIVDAVACLLDGKILDESGCLEEDKYIIQAPVGLIPKDIRMLQLAKSAICGGMLTLLDHRRVQPEAVSALYIAGGFGNYLNIQSAVRIGLLPVKLAEAARVIGNGALDGAAMLLLDPKRKVRAEQLAKDAEVLDLSTNSVFAEYYVAGMLLSEI